MFPDAFPTPPSPVSSRTIHIAGISTVVFGLAELPPNVSDVACLWLLHPRPEAQSCMQPVASFIINAWNSRLNSGNSGDGASPLKAYPPGLIAVSLDHRNHGGRLVDKVANHAWSSGNPTHAQDMFSIYQGTAVDVSVLIDHLPSYIFEDPTLKPPRRITTNLVLGISLGGHSAWHCIFHEPRISAAIVIIGCPDFERLMFDRAAKSKLDTWTGRTEDFRGSKSYPLGLVEAVRKHDPAGILLRLNGVNGNHKECEPSSNEKENLNLLLNNHLAGKRILNLAGGADKLVSHKFSVPFLTFLERAIDSSGWASCKDVVLEDIVFEGVGHALSAGMMKEATRFVCQFLAGELPPNAFKQSAKKESKM